MLGDTSEPVHSGLCYRSRPCPGPCPCPLPRSLDRCNRLAIVTARLSGAAATTRQSTEISNCTSDCSLLEGPVQLTDIFHDPVTSCSQTTREVTVQARARDG